VGYLLALQIILSVLVALIFYVFLGVTSAWDIIVGAVLVGLNMWLMQRVFRREDIKQRDIYVSAASRYVLFIVALLFCAWLGLNLLAMLGGMLLAYVVSYFFSAYIFLSLSRK